MTVLTRRALNRATLARQLLLVRADLPVPAAVAHLAGLQAQTPHTWYVGLWTRLAGLDPVAVGELLERRELVRLPVMRSTIHLLTADDALALRPLTQQAIERSTLGQFGRHLTGIEPAALAAAAAGLVEERPLIASELGRLLAERFPGHDPGALAQGARAWLPMVQVPPRGVWGRGGRALQAPLESWLGRRATGLPVADLVRRYLAAFGPATVRDAQTWSGLTRLAEVFDALRPELREFAGGLFDLPAAPRPDPETPAPVRFLYDYDNLLLSHADRGRVFGESGDTDYGAHGYTADSNVQPASVLVDGVVAATWTLTRQRRRSVLSVRAFRTLRRAESAEVAAEGAALLTFLHPGDEHDVRLT
jgi:hypothetical protein